MMSNQQPIHRRAVLRAGTTLGLSLAAPIVRGQRMPAQR